MEPLWGHTAKVLWQHQAAATDAFQDETIEVVATHEEPVTSKIACVAEEVVVQKERVETTERVRDTVQRTDVEIESTALNQEAGRETRRTG